jgi:hypothetical protein
MYRHLLRVLNFTVTGFERARSSSLSIPRARSRAEWRAASGTSLGRAASDFLLP